MMQPPSLTARRVAERRAAHQILDTPVVLSDPLALRIVGATDVEGRQRLIAREQGRLARTMRAFMAARSRFTEDELARRVGEGLTQYVLLGAGLDTFGYRNPFTSRLRVFEVDQPGTQQWKRDRLSAAGIESTGVSYVSLDFEREDVFEALAAAGWDRTRPTLFAWLGVTMYLDPDTVRSMLSAIATLPAGTQVVFDYMIAPDLLTPVERLIYDEFATRVASIGEPWICSFDNERLRQELQSLGFTALGDLGPDELNARYFHERTDGMRVGALGRIMSATR